MARLVFKKGEQGEFLTMVQQKLNLKTKEVAEIVGISARSYRYWLNEKTLGTKDAIYKLCELSDIKLPIIIEQREDFWSGRVNGRLGGLKTFKIYGAPGNIYSRANGGKSSQENRKKDPEYYRAIGCNVAKDSKVPKHSKQLAEIVGVILGDGGVTKNQLKITLNSVADSGYDMYLCESLYKLFNLNVGKFKRKNAKAIDLFISGVNFVNTLQEVGLKVGNKVAQQVSVPEWISSNLTFSKWCLRGLMDTDGGIFKNKYRINGREYSYLKACFTNKSLPLINFVSRTLEINGFTPKVYKKNKVWLCSEKEVLRYLSVVGSSNNRLNKMAKW